MQLCASTRSICECLIRPSLGANSKVFTSRLGQRRVETDHGGETSFPTRQHAEAADRACCKATEKGGCAAQTSTRNVPGNSRLRAKFRLRAESGPPNRRDSDDQAAPVVEKGAAIQQMLVLGRSEDDLRVVPSGFLGALDVDQTVQKARLVLSVSARWWTVTLRGGGTQ